MYRSKSTCKNYEWNASKILAVCGVLTTRILLSSQDSNLTFKVLYPPEDFNSNRLQLGVSVSDWNFTIRSTYISGL